MASSRHQLQFVFSSLCSHVNLLAIETSTEFLSLAVGGGGKVCTHHVAAGQRHAELVLDAIAALLERAGLEPEDLDGIAYGEGPGSFTGLRIACGVAQGLALAWNRKVLGVSTLLALAEEAGASSVLACLDARMGEVYHAAYRRMVDGWQVAHAPALCKPDQITIPEGDAWNGCGSGFAAYGEVLQRRLGSALSATRPDVAPTASAILRLLRPRFERGEGFDPASAVPVYLRDKVALKTSER
jgi:tRNA threonylcarbamoyladenosine biosynthesis protein TsaB